MPNALVTGTSGYLGSRIAAHLTDGGFAVTRVPGRRETAELASAAPGTVDLIVHAGFAVDFSATRSDDAESESVRNTRLVARWGASHGAPHLVFLSAAGALGVSSNDRARAEDSVGLTDGPFEDYRATRYIRDKLACEPILAGYPGIATTLYLTTVYGAGISGPVRDSLARLKGPSPLVAVPPGGTSYLDLLDLLDALDRVVAQRPAGRFVLSSGNLTYARLYRAAAGVLGVAWRKRIVVLPAASRKLVERLARLLPGRAPAVSVLLSAFGYKYYSSERARRQLGFLAKRPLTATLEAVLARP